jgi:ribosomal protein S18 acetylase RimI-like enzyme
MKNLIYKITKLSSTDELPFDLLLLADETKEAIEKYIYNSEVYVVKNPQLISVAVFVLYKLNETEIEIKNIAVSETIQGKGIGSFLIDEIRRIVTKEDYKTIIVGTPEVSYRQINFYKKNGFSKYAVKKNFFIENYTEPIIEDGILLKDMVMLKLEVD